MNALGCCACSLATIGLVMSYAAAAGNVNELSQWKTWMGTHSYQVFIWDSEMLFHSNMFKISPSALKTHYNPISFNS